MRLAANAKSMGLGDGLGLDATLVAGLVPDLMAGLVAGLELGFTGGLDVPATLMVVIA